MARFRASRGTANANGGTVSEVSGMLLSVRQRGEGFPCSVVAASTPSQRGEGFPALVLSVESLSPSQRVGGSSES